ncbi:MAG: hypothetical protein U5K71_09005 [Gracilimonas sp.]|nr:hypothetical protein [Gracilimonas sp.]
MFAQGRVELFNGESVCDLTQLNVLETESQAVFNCPDDASVSLVENSAQLELMLDNLGGVIDYNFEDDEFGYDLNANGSIALGLESAGQCTAHMQLNLEDINGLTVGNYSNLQHACAPHRSGIHEA